MKRFYKQWLLALMWISIATIAQAQDFTVSGKVTDGATGEGLVGTNIIVKGTTNGTISDIEGNYSLSVPGNSATLVFSSIGYLTQEVAASSTNSTVNITLAEDITNLEEVVVTGLASSIKRSNLANAVGTVSGDELMGTTKAQTVDNALYGKITGATYKIQWRSTRWWQFGTTTWHFHH